jgi:UDP:flavonoid glycosyltransferase YjiC (YdhE family)
MGHVDAYVTNGGYGGLHFAMRHGVPILSAGATEDKPDLAARVSWSGVGIGMRAQRANPAKVRAAVRRLLDEDRFRARAQQVAEEMAAYDGPARASELVEDLVARRSYAAAAAGAASGDLAGVNA